MSSIEKAQEAEEAYEDSKRGWQEEKKKILRVSDYPEKPTGVILPYQSSNEIPENDSIRQFNYWQKIEGVWVNKPDTLKVK